MRVPSTVNESCLKAYQPEKRCAQRWKNRKIRRFSIGNWDNKIPKTLQTLCIECMVNNWTDYPILDEIILPEDRHLLLDMLPETLPLELTIPKINDEIYWKKCYIKRWPKKLPKIKNEIQWARIVRNGVNETNEAYLNKALGNQPDTVSYGDHPSIGSKSSSRRTSRKVSLKTTSGLEQEGRTWKKYYCEMHVKDYLESLKPENYNPEKIKELCDLCGSYIEILKIDNMISSENSSTKIPLNAIITGLQNLTELSLRFKQVSQTARKFIYIEMKQQPKISWIRLSALVGVVKKLVPCLALFEDCKNLFEVYAKEDFSWNIVNTSYQDICLLAKGLEKIRLQTLRITNSDIDCDKIITILKALLKHDLAVLDLSHCKIGNRGMIAISKFIIENSAKEIFLGNNRIGSKGIDYLAYAVAQKSCNVKTLDLHLNQFLDKAGNLLLNSIVNYNSTIKSISMSGCGLTEHFAVANALKKSNYLEELDISNNVFGEEIGTGILQALQFNGTLKKLDVRMCKVPSVIEAEIQYEVNKNRKGCKKPFYKAIDETDISWDDNLAKEMEEILLDRAMVSISPETNLDDTPTNIN